MLFTLFGLPSAIIIIIISFIHTFKSKRSFLLISWLFTNITFILFWFNMFFVSTTMMFTTLAYIILGIFDLNSKHNILRNYPVIGHIRFLFEFIRPEIQQYFIATNHSGRPYPREVRTLIYQRSKNMDETHPFGTEKDITQPGHWYALHSINVNKVDPQSLRRWIGNKQCSIPYHASIMNISAMSYGSLSPTAVKALNLGAKQAKIYQNTGEGGISSYHLNGGDLVWQIGTGYFGCRQSDGTFDAKLFAKKATLPKVKMIEIKLSQGAKPSHGGILPKAKITPEIAKIRGIPMNKDCLSPPTHSAFKTPREMMLFIQKLRKLSEGKPIGFKCAIGQKKEFYSICHAMLETQIYPDFITVDGAEGGTGAAPLIFTNHLATPGLEALRFVYNSLIGCGLKKHITLIASAKIVTAFDIAKFIGAGADAVNCARPFLFSVGCIQAIKCNTNECPTGVTTTDPHRYIALQPELKAKHIANLHQNTLHSLAELIGAMGCKSHEDLTAESFLYRVEQNKHISLTGMYGSLTPNELITHPENHPVWQLQTADQF